MRITSRHLIGLNGLTVLACLFHVLVHAFEVQVGEWHDVVVYVLVAASFTASLLHGRQQRAEPLTA